MKFTVFIPLVYFLLSIPFFFYLSSGQDLDMFQIFGIALSEISFVSWIWARFQLAGSFAWTPKKPARLVTTGFYSRISHPLYFFQTLVFLGVLLFISNLLLYLALIPYSLLQTYRIQKENALLKKSFGSEYEKYRQQVWF